LLKALDAVTGKYPGLPILVGGQAFRWGGVDAVQAYPNVCHLATLDALEQKLLAYEQ
jgi:hypothetical protein